MSFVETNGLRLHYLDHGSGDNTLILMPGLTANAHFFGGLVNAGLAGRMRVLAVDLRGRGESDKPDTGYTMADHAADILGMLDALGLDKVIMGGHSFGGLLTFYLAAHHPERIDRSVVIDAPAVVEDTILDQLQPSLDRLEMTLPSWDHYLAMVKGMPYYDGWWDPAIEEFYRADIEQTEDGAVRARSRPNHIRQAVEGTMQVDWLATVAEIRDPVLFLRAPEPFGPPGSPPIVPEHIAIVTAGRIPDCRMMDLSGNHITCMFGASASIAAHAIVEFVEHS